MTTEQLSIPNKKLLEQFGQNGTFVLSSETQNQLTKSHERKRYNFPSPPVRNKRQFRSEQFNYESDINSDESQRILKQLESDRTLLDMQNPIKPLKTATKPLKKGRKHSTPAAGFKSLYQLSLMLGKGFNIDDLYLVQDSFSKEDLHRKRPTDFGPLPFTTVNPPVTVVPLKPQMPSTRFEPLPSDYVATIKPLRKGTKEMFDLRKEAREMFDLYTSDNDFYSEIINTIDPELGRVKSAIGIGCGGDLEAKSSRSKSKSSIKASSVKTQSSNSISTLSKCGLLRKDIYDLSDEESTPSNSEDELPFDGKHLKNQVVMFSCNDDLPSSHESTKANASLSSRLGLDDVNSDPHDCQAQSSERAHPLRNTATPGTAMRTYEQAIGKDLSKGAQRSHTFSGLEWKKKKKGASKDRSAMSFPTIFKYN